MDLIVYQFPQWVVVEGHITFSHPIHLLEKMNEEQLQEFVNMQVHIFLQEHGHHFIHQSNYQWLPMIQEIVRRYRQAPSPV